MTQRRPSRQTPPAGTGPGSTVAGPTRPRVSHSGLVPSSKGRRDLTKRGSSSESLRPVREGSKTRVSRNKRGTPAARLSHSQVVAKRAEDARWRITAMLSILDNRPVHVRVEEILRLAEVVLRAEES